LKSDSSATKKQSRVPSGEILATRCSRDPFTYLVYIVPFSDMLRCQCLKTTAEPSTLLFGNPFRPLETLATSALTKALQSLSVATSLFNSFRKMLTIIAPLTCEWIEQCDGGSDWGKGIRLSWVVPWYGRSGSGLKSMNWCSTTLTSMALVIDQDQLCPSIHCEGPLLQGHPRGTGLRSYKYDLTACKDS